MEPVRRSRGTFMGQAVKLIAETKANAEHERADCVKSSELLSFTYGAMQSDFGNDLIFHSAHTGS